MSFPLQWLSFDSALITHMHLWLVRHNSLVMKRADCLHRCVSNAGQEKSPKSDKNKAKQQKKRCFGKKKQHSKGEKGTSSGKWDQ